MGVYGFETVAAMWLGTVGEAVAEQGIAWRRAAAPRAAWKDCPDSAAAAVPYVLQLE